MLGKLLVFLVIIGAVFYAGLAYEYPLTCYLLGHFSINFADFFGCGYQTTPPNTSNSIFVGNSTLKTKDVNQYDMGTFVSNISKVQSGIKSWKSFSNYTTNYQSQLNAFNNFVVSVNISKFFYYAPKNVYAMYSFTIVDTYYKNGSFSNYNPSLIGQVVNVSLVGGVLNLGIGHNNTPKHFYNLPYKITGMKLGSKGIIYWKLTEDFENNPTLINATSISFANRWNMTSGVMGLHFANGTEAVLTN